VLAGEDFIFGRFDGVEAALLTHNLSKRGTYVHLEGHNKLPEVDDVLRFYVLFSLFSLLRILGIPRLPLVLALTVTTGQR
jgi:hypothetical protein